MMSLNSFRNSIALASAAISAVLLVIPAACSSGGLQHAGSTLPTAAVDAALLDLSLPGACSPDTISVKDLYVGEFGYGPYTNVVGIFQNGSFKKVGQIKLGIDHPYGIWVDSHGLYVANNFGPSITEYRSPNSKPFTYKAGMTSPQAVTTDGVGGVFEADLAGYVNEYGQKSNVVEKKCSVPGSASGIAMDSHGNVFVAYHSSGVGRIAEFTDFSYCTGQQLGVTLGTPGGMAIDRNNHIVISDLSKRTVDVIKPPYKTVSSLLGSHWTFPMDVAINAANNRSWIVDNGAVVDLYYPSGKVAATIGATYAVSAVDGNNYVP